MSLLGAYLHPSRPLRHGYTRVAPGRIFILGIFFNRFTHTRSPTSIPDPSSSSHTLRRTVYPSVRGATWRPPEEAAWFPISLQFHRTHCCGTYEQQSRESKSLQNQPTRLRISVLGGRVFRAHRNRRAGSTDFHGWDGWSLNPGRRHGHRRPGLLAEVPHLLAMRLTYVTAPFGPLASN